MYFRYLLLVIVMFSFEFSKLFANEIPVIVIAPSKTVQSVSTVARQ